MESENIDIPLDLLLALFEGAINETWEKNPLSSYPWVETHALLGHLVDSIIEEVTVKHFQDGLVGMKIFEWQRNILWSLTAVYGGAYECALRELRFMLEDAVQSVYADQVMGDVEIEAKVRSLQMIEDRRMRGQEIIKKCEISQDVKTALVTLYRDLSGYVHPSEYVTRESLRDGKFVFFYIEDSFNECVEIHKRGYDGFLALLLSFFPDAANHFLETKVTREHANTIQEALTNMGFNLTLSVSKSLANP